MGQVHNIYEYNRAAKQKKLVASFLVSRSRKHGRPRNVGRITKVRMLKIKEES